ncbi:MAG: hypothetical protein AAF366_13080 [Pseudomonadota bacterium]
MSPELTLLIVNAVFLGFAYLWVYPGLPSKRLGILARYDLAIGGAALLVAGLLFAGRDLPFRLIFVDMPWWLYSVLTFSLLELPAWEWFRRRHGIDYDDF